MNSKFIVDLYKSCKALQVVTTQNEFSTNICGKSPRWFSVVSSNDRTISTDSLVRAYKNIEALAQKQENSHIKLLLIDLVTDIKNHIDNKLAPSSLEIQTQEISTGLENYQKKYSSNIKKIKNISQQNSDNNKELLKTIKEIINSNTMFIQELKESLKELE